MVPPLPASMHLAVAFVSLVVSLIVAGRDSWGAPCFPKLRVARIDSELTAFSPWVDDDGVLTGGNGTWGTCRVQRGRVRAPDGTVVAAVGCGVQILVPGFVDDHGIEVGTRGRRVIEVYGAEAAARLVCAHTFEPQVRRTRCWFPPARDSGDDQDWSYVVPGRLPTWYREHGEVLRGDAALRFLRARKIVAIWDRGSCH